MKIESNVFKCTIFATILMSYFRFSADTESNYKDIEKLYINICVHKFSNRSGKNAVRGMVK